MSNFGSQFDAIVFCFPYKKVGGVSVLFLRMAQYLANHYQTEICLVDYADGYMAKNIADKRIKLIPYYDDKKVSIPNNALLILQSMTPWSIFPSLEIPLATKLFFWTCHPLNFAIALPSRFAKLYQYPRIYRLLYRTILGAYYKKIIDFLKLGLENNAIYFMDSAVVKTTKDLLGYKFSPPEYLPIPCLPDKNISQNKISTQNDSTLFQITWIGRLVDFKIYMLITLILSITRYAEKYKKQILISIIGDGSEKEIVEKYSYGNEYCRIEFLGELSLNEVHAFLQKTNLLLAMGTSALEGARIGVPTIRVDISYKILSNYHGFQFLYQSENYCLGEIVSENGHRKGDSIDALLDETINNYDKVSQETYNYCASNFFIDRVCEKFMQFSDRTTLTYSQLLNARVTKKGMLYQCYKTMRLKL